MTWPTLPPFSANNFLDHFPGSSLNARWTAITSGSGAVTVTDSYVNCHTTAAADAAAIYYNTKLDLTKSQLWLFNFNEDSNSGADEPFLTMWSGASAPVADTASNYGPNIVMEWESKVISSIQSMIFRYQDGASAFHWWDGSGQAFSTTFNTVALDSMQLSDFYIVGLEIDAPNSQMRSFIWGRAFDTAGTWTTKQGWKLFVQTDWIAFSSLNFTTNLWLILGSPYTTFNVVGDMRFEWVRYAECRTGNIPVDAWSGAKSALANNHQIRHYYSYDGLTFVAQDRTTWAIVSGGAGTWDAGEIHEPMGVWDGASTDYLFYTGHTAGGTAAFGYATATHVAAPQNGTWTKYASNPILSLGAAGANDDNGMSFPYVFMDKQEANANKRWKMLYAGLKASDSKWRTLYATAPDPPTVWTKQGVAIDVGAAASPDETEARYVVVIWYNNQFEVWYGGADSNHYFHLLRATGTDLASLTKDGTDYTIDTAADQALTANLSTAPGRTVTVGSTTNFLVDDPVVICQANDGDTYSTSVVRKVVNSTTLELYHGLTGFTTTTPARIRRLSERPATAQRWLGQVGAEWWMYMVNFEPFGGGNITPPDGATYFALLEQNFLYKHAAVAPNGATFAPVFPPGPVTSRGFNNDGESLENITLLNPPLVNIAPYMPYGRQPFLAT